MSHVVNLPVTYSVEGIPRGRRKVCVVPVVEMVSFEIRELERPHGVVRHGGFPFRIAEGRPWFPIVGENGRPATTMAIDGMVERFVEREPSNSGVVDHGIGISPLLGRPFRNFQPQERPFAIPPGKTIRDDLVGPFWRSPYAPRPERRPSSRERPVVLSLDRDLRDNLNDAFSKVVAGDRRDSIEVSRRVSERLAVMGGVLVTDRYEPLEDASMGRGRVKGALTYDVVTGRETVVQRYANGSLVYGARNSALPGSIGLMPERERWYDRIEWEIDPILPVAHWLARHLRRYVVGSDGVPILLREAMGYATYSPLACIVQWYADVEGVRNPPMTGRTLSGFVEAAIEGLGSADRLGLREEFGRIDAVLSTAKDYLHRIADRTLAPSTSIAEDVLVLRPSPSLG